MRIRLTVLANPTTSAATYPDGPANPERTSHDVEVRAPAGTVLGDLQNAFDEHFEGGADATGRSPRLIWAGSRALPSTAVVGGPGLRNGSILGLGSPGPRRTDTTTVLALHVVGGPDAGLVAGLPGGSLQVGRGPGCGIRLADPDVSRRHLEISVTSRGVQLRDLGSMNGATLLSDDDRDCVPLGQQPTPVEVGRYIGLGETILSLASVACPAAATSMGEDGRLVLNRPPRLAVTLPARELISEAGPNTTERPALPWLAAIIPGLGGAALALFMHNPQFLAFALLSPVLMLGTSIGDRFTGRGRRRRERAATRARLAQVLLDTTALAREETTFRRAAHPDPAAIRHAASTPDVRVWERRANDADFLDVRLGLTDQPATFVVRHGGQLRDAPLLSALPLTVNLRRGALGVCGPREPALALARWSIAQLATLHSPADLALAAVLDDGDVTPWSWLSWLPHGRSDPDRPMAIARSVEQRQALVAGLNSLIDARRHRSDRGNSEWAGPWTVLIIDRAALQADITGIGRLLREGPSVGVTAICIDDEVRRLPPACTSVARMTGETGSRVSVGTSTGPGRTCPRRSGRAGLGRRRRPGAGPTTRSGGQQLGRTAGCGAAARHQRGLPGCDVGARPLVRRDGTRAGPARGLGRRTVRYRSGSRRTPCPHRRDDRCREVGTVTDPGRRIGGQLGAGGPAVRADRLQGRCRVCAMRAAAAHGRAGHRPGQSTSPSGRSVPWTPNWGDARPSSQPSRPRTWTATGVQLAP